MLQPISKSLPKIIDLLKRRIKKIRGKLSTMISREWASRKIKKDPRSTWPEHAILPIFEATIKLTLQSLLKKSYHGSIAKSPYNSTLKNLSDPWSVHSTNPQKRIWNMTQLP